MENYRECTGLNEESIKMVEENHLKMVAGGANCPGHTWKKIDKNLYYCPKCKTYEMYNLE